MKDQVFSARLETHHLQVLMLSITPIVIVTHRVWKMSYFNINNTEARGNYRLKAGTKKAFFKTG